METGSGLFFARQDVAILVHKPEHRAAALTCELVEIEGAFNYRTREIADRRLVKRFDELARSAAQEIGRGQPGFEHAEQVLEEMRAVMRRVLWSDPQFVAEVFHSVAEESYVALDLELHAHQVEAGREALRRGDVDGLRDIVIEMIGNRISLPARQGGDYAGHDHPGLRTGPWVSRRCAVPVTLVIGRPPILRLDVTRP